MDGERMNYFLELKVFNRDRTVWVRPEHVSAVDRRDDDPYVYVSLINGEQYIVERGQFTLNTLVNRTGHAGMRVQ